VLQYGNKKMHKILKIFIAEDEVVLNEIYSQRFSQSGFTVKSFYNGEDLIAALTDETPDVVLLDMNMPKMTGFEVLNTIHQNFQSKDKQDVLVIAWSSLNNEADIQKVKMTGATVFLHKGDYEGQDLVDKVNLIYKEKLPK
jgi:CheY-like chemotaxis protein